MKFSIPSSIEFLSEFQPLVWAHLTLIATNLMGNTPAQSESRRLAAISLRIAPRVEVGFSCSDTIQDKVRLRIPDICHV